MSKLGQVVYMLVTDRWGHLVARPAMVVRDNGGSVNLQVFLDGGNDAGGSLQAMPITAPQSEAGLAWRTSVMPGSETFLVGYFDVEMLATAAVLAAEKAEAAKAVLTPPVDIPVTVPPGVDPDPKP